ncbi:hypothetical protein GNI_092170 [Gregarina niphandrodes]|uniref:Uncharacterized protein n=1 Tax=Gregarina niphandrodes TaxID=110365 RepID=A0A023B5B5_GRENI|nr:hypothetical protein GNI_092170 [Gregarina niphandrodes]EZG59594.1 hypothetical protein GNI_092170 [Gregarina niphandrodes]|eukprot:XP_011130887.1 hypothetical protein GNI_092170 [Gregarina niphandrodes]
MINNKVGGLRSSMTEVDRPPNVYAKSSRKKSDDGEALQSTVVEYRRARIKPSYETRDAGIIFRRRAYASKTED